MNLPRRTARVLLGVLAMCVASVALAQAPAVVIAPQMLTVEEGSNSGASNIYTVKLATEPSGTVTVTPRVGGNVADHGVTLTTAPATAVLTFDGGNWNEAQTVTVAAVADGTEATDDTATIRHAVVGYGGVMSAADVVVTVTDIDLAHATVPRFAAADTVDDQTYTVNTPITALTLPTVRAGSGDGEITYALEPMTDIPDGLTFDPGTRVLSGTPTIAAAATTVTLIYTAADSDVRTGGIDEDSLTFVVTIQAEPVALLIEPTTLTVVEGGSDIYTVRLSARPVSSVDVGLNIRGALDIFLVRTGTPSVELGGLLPLTFTTANWDVPQTVSVLAHNDSNAVDDTYTLTHIATGTSARIEPVNVTVTVRDTSSPRNDVNISIFRRTLQVRENTSEIYRVRLTDRPSGNATVTYAATPADHDLTLTPAGGLTFTAGNWIGYQTVTVTAGDDADTIDDTATISHTLAGYGATTAVAVRVTTIDDNSGNPLAFGAGRVVHVFQPLTGFPPGTVLPIATGGTGALSYALTPTGDIPNGLSFNALTHTLNGTTALGAVAATLTYTATDSATPPSTVSRSVVLVLLPLARPSFVHRTRTNTGDNALRVRLGAAPASDVTVRVTVSLNGGAVPANYRYGPRMLTFTPANWSTPQTVTTAIDGFTRANVGDYWVKFPASIGGYSSFPSRTYDYSVLLAHRAIASPNTLRIGETDTEFYTVALEPLRPEAGETVTVTPTSTDNTVVTTSGAVTFTDADWNIPKTITVTGVADDDSVNESFNITHQITSTGGEYSRAVTDAVAVTVIDGDAEAFIGGGDAVATEGTTLNVPVGIRFAARTAPSTVRFALRGSAATADYEVLTQSTPAGERITFDPATATGAIELSAAQTRRNLAVRLLGDAVADNGETLVVTLTEHTGSDPPRHTVGPNARRTYLINEAPLAFAAAATVDDQTYNREVAVSVALPEATGGSGIVTYALTPDADIPAGLAFAPGTRELRGVPSEVASAVTLTYTATDAGGASVSQTFAVTVDVAPAVVISETALSVAEGGSNTYTVTLTVDPGGAVTVTPMSGNTDAVPNPDALTFAAGEWNTPQTVTVTAAEEDDWDFADATATISHAVAGYTGVTSAADLVVTVDDNDTDTPPTFAVTQSDRTYVVDNAVDLTLPTATGGNGTLTYALTPDITAIVSGLSFDNNTRVLSGTANTVTAAVTLTYTATDADDVSGAGDEASLTFAVTVNPVAAVMFDPSALTVAEGATGGGAYAVELSVAPDSGDVTVTPSLNGGGLTFAPAVLTFSSGNWNTAQDIVITAARDDDTDDATLTVSHAVVGAGNYSALTDGGEVVVTVTDNSMPAVRISTDALSVNEGESDVYTVRLATIPTGNVVITPTPTATATLSPTGALTFTAGNWNEEQTVTVTGVADADAVANVDATISHAATSPDADYNNISPIDDVTVTVTDTSTPAVRISTDTLTVNEGESDVYTVRLVTIPTANVVITPTATATATVSAALTFTAGDWNDEQTVTVTGVVDADAVANVDATISHAATSVDADYNAISPIDDVTVTVTETDSVGFTVTPPTLSLSEGNSGFYTVELTAAPSVGAVTVTPDSADSGAVSIFAATAELVFTDADWNVAQTVSVRAEADDDTDDESVRVTNTVTVSVASSEYAGESADKVTVTVNDTSIPAVRISTDTLTVNEGESDVYTVRLATSPTGNVVITPTSTATATLSPTGALTFTAGNWNDAQTVTVTGVADADAVANVDATISHAATSVDADYNAISPIDDVTVTVTETDSVGFTVTPPTLSLSEGNSGFYTVVLTSAPSVGAVTVTPDSADSGAVSIFAATAELVFTDADWNVAQTVSVRAEMDADANDETVTIGNAVSVSDSSSDYAAQIGNAADVTVTVTDNSMPAVRISTDTLSVNEGVAATYTVRLATIPTGNVVITPTPTATATVSGALTFTAADWNDAQTITVTGVADDDAVANVDATISHAATSPDADYDAITPIDDVTVTVTDTDMAEVTISESTLSVSEYGMNTYTIVLMSAPGGGGNATVTPMSGDPTIATVSDALTFTADNWDDEQTVTVSGVEDPDPNDESTNITHTVSGYDAITTADPVAVTVTDPDTVGVMLSTNTVTLTESTTGFYTVELDTEPSGNVTITPMSDTPAAATVSGALTFTPANWNEEQSVIITGVDDANTETDTAQITHTIAGGDYGGVGVGMVTATVTDTDTAGVTISAGTLSIGEDTSSGTANTYTVVLNTEPSGAVTVALVSSDTDAVTASVSTVNFSATDWNTPKDVVLTGVEDDDGNNETVNITHTVSGANYADAAISPNPVVVTVDDNDPLGIRLSVTALSVGEGATANYTVRLNTEPDGNVTITPTSGDIGAATVSAALTFTDSNWNTAQQVEVTGVDDFDATNETVTITHAATGSADYAAVVLTGETVMVTVTDNDPRGITLSGVVPVTVTEGASANYGVVLDTQPTGNVTVTPTSDTPAVATVSGALVFTTANWNTAQSVTVTGTEDADSEPDSASITHAVTGADYATVTLANVAVTVTDNDMPGVTISTATLTIGEDTSSGAGNTYNVVLNTEPSGDVTVMLSSDNTEVTLSAATLNFTAANWNMPQDVVVSAAEDDDATDDSADITHEVSGANYAGAAISNNPVAVTVTDNETRGVTISPASLGITEESSGFYTVALTSAPDGGDVTVTPSSDDAAATVTGALTFTATAGNWNTAQTVIVTATTDPDTENETATITHRVDGADYGGVTANNVVVTVTDNDTPGVTISPTTLTVDEGEDDTYTVRLATLPNGNVTVTPMSGNAAATVSPTGGLIFSTSNWNAVQAVTVFGAHDDDAADGNATITHEVEGANYAGVTARSVAVTITDDEDVSVAISDSTVTVDEGAGGAYTVTLTSEPVGGAVTVTPSIPTGTDLTLSPATGGLTFTAGNWNVAQMVALSAAEDADAVDDAVNITHAATGADYAAAPADDVAVTIDDNDNVGVTVTPDALSVNEGEFATYTVELTSAPSVGAVTVTPSSADGGAVSVTAADPTTPAVLVFAAANWNIQQVVSVGGVADADATDESVEITNTVTVSDGASEYAAATADEVTVTVNDADEPGVTISTAALSVAEDGNNTYTVVLNTEPTGDVAVALTIDNTDVTADTTTVNFTMSNWNTAQNVVISAAQDPDGNDDIASITHTVSGADYNGATITNAVVAVTVDDDDMLGITLSVTALSVTEEGATANYTVELDTEPDGNVTITPMSGDIGAATVSAALVFTASNWNTAQPVVVTGVDDFDATNETVTITHAATGSADYAAVDLTAETVMVTVTDNDPRGITLSGTPVTVTEGMSGGYTVELDTQPTDSVTVTPDSDDEEVATVSAALTFTTANWNTAQSVIVTGAEDDNAIANSTRITHAVSGADYAGVTAGADDVAVTVNDNDSVGVTVTATDPIVVNEDAFGSYTVVLTSAPSVGEVTVTPSSGDDGAVSVTGALVFDANNWNMPQPVSVGGVADDDAVDETVVVSHAVTVSDGSSDYMDATVTPAGDVTVTVTDNDTAGVTVSASTLTVVEEAMNTYTIVLMSAPGGGGNATVTPMSGDDTIATTTGALTFTADNWDDEQTVTVSGVEDPDPNDESTNITHTVSGYDTITTADPVAVTVTDPDTVGVMLSTNTVTLTESTTGFYTVELDTEPSGNVTITPMSDTPAAATVSGALTFTPANWNEEQSVIITGVDDANTETDTAQITHTIAGGDYGGVGVGMVTATVTDTDTAGVTISAGTLSIGEGMSSSAANTYTVVLNTEPSGAVTVALVSSDTDAVTASVSTVNFSATDWNTPKDVVLTGVEDDDGNNETVNITHTVSGANYADAAISPNPVVVTVTDNDPRGITLSVTALSVGEGATANYTVRLNTEPDGNVTLTPTSDDTSAATVSAALIFTDSNWNTAQQVVVTGEADDDATHETVTITHAATGSADYAAVVLTAETVTVTVTDNDPRGVTVPSTPVSVTEGETANYGVVLDTQPTGDVTVTPDSDTPAVATVSGALVFTPANWNTAQSVTVTGTEDADSEPDSASITHAVAGADYASVTVANVAVTVTDNDMPGVTISTATLTIGEGTSSGTGNTYTVVLTTEPSGDVTVMLDSNNDDVTTNAATLNFGTGNWNTPQDVIVSAAEDNDATDDTADITHTVSGANYNGADITPNAVVTVTVTDNEMRGVTIAPTSVTIPEGDSNTYTVRLTSAPDGGTVMVTPTIPAGNDLLLFLTGGAPAATAVLTFDMSNWNVAQPVTLTATADDDAVADAAIVVTHAVTGADYEINNVTAADVTATITEDDAPGVTISTATLSVAEDGNNTYTVVLNTEPTGPVTVALTIDNSDVTADTATVNFTMSNWNTAQTVTISAAEDFDGNDDTASITHTVSGADYDGATITNPVVTVTVTDNDTRGIRLSATTLSVTEGATANYTVRLNTLPDGEVTIMPTSGDIGAATVSAALTFTTANWNTAQPVVVTGVDDFDATNEMVSITHAATGSADYAAVVLTGETVMVTVTDDDPRGVTLLATPVTVTEGASANYGVVLDTQPSGDVTVTPTSDTPAIATVSPTGGLVFTTANWNTAQSVTVTGTEDADSEGDSTSITHAVTGADYDGFTLANVAVSVTDNDMPGVTISTATLTIGEDTSSGAGNTYNVVLTTEPSGAVTVMLSSDNGDVTTNPATLNFGAGNWNTAQNVIVSAAEDPDATDDTADIMHTVSGANYDAAVITPDTVTVTVTDNGTRSVTITPPTLALTEGDSPTYSVALTSAPDGGDVTVTPTIPAGADVRLDPSGAFVFDASNWSVAQTRSVVAEQDEDAVTDADVTITHAVTGADYESNNVTAGNLTVMIAEDDSVGLTINAASPFEVDEGGAVRLYTVVLDAAPSVGEVTVTPTNPDTDALSVSGALVFGASNWNTSQRVMVSGVADDDAVDETVVITNRVTVSDSSSDYMGQTAPSVTVTVTDPGMASVTVAPTTLTVPENGNNTYTIVLTSAPSGGGNATVTPASDNTAAATVSPTGGLVFTAADWNDMQTVTVTGVADADAADDSVDITHTVSGYDSIATAATVTVTVTDTSVRGLTLTGTPVTVTEGANITYAVVLNTQPSGNVTVTPASGDTAVATVSSALVFGATNWNTTQNITVTGTEDANTEADTTTITHTVSGADYAGVSVSADPVMVTVNDNDMPGVTVSKATLDIDEGSDSGTDNTYTVVLTTEPSGTVTVTLTSSNPDVRANPATLNFDAGNWNTMQNVTIIVEQDPDGNNDTANIMHAVSGANYGSAAISPNPVVVTVTDNDPLGITLSVNTLSVGENATANYTVELDTEPDGNVTITPTSADPGAATVSAALVFTPTNWNTAQQVMVTGVADDDAANEMFNITHAATGSADYAAVVLTAATVAVTVTDDDPRGITLSGTPVTVAEGASVNYGVVLDTQPSGDVVVTPSSANTAIATVSGPLTFTTANWNTAQSVMVTGVDDSNTEADNTSITHAVTGADYAGVNAANVIVTVTDNDMPGVTISTGTLAVGEGGNNTYTVVLNTEPSGAVAVALSSDNDDVTTNAATLNFTTANWNTPQDVIVSAAEDPDATDDSADITHTVSGANYDGITAISNNPVVVTVTDNEMRGVTVALPSGGSSLPEGSAGTYTVVLTSAPVGGEVMLMPRSDNRDVTFGVSTLIFSATNWNVVQTLGFDIAEDDDANGDNAVISHTVSGADYGGFTVAELRLSIIDNDMRGVTLSRNTLSVAESATANYTVRLTTQPTANVVITPASGDTGVATVSGPLTFTSMNWNIAQPVMVAGVKDADAVADAAVSITHSAASTDTDYDGIAAAAVTVTVTETDTRGVTISRDSVTVLATAAATYTVVLDTLPSASVIVTPSSDTDAVTVAPATLTFTTGNWNTAQTVTVTGTARALISHAVTGTGDYTGVTAASVRVLFGGTEAMDALNAVILPEVANVMVGNHVSAITHRITQARTPTGRAGTGLRANLGGHSTLEALAATHAQTMVDGGLDTKTLLADSDFAMPLSAGASGSGGGANLALWGSGDYRNIGGDSNNVDWDGSLFSAHLGVDVALQPGLLAGVMLAWSEADLEYTNRNTATAAATTGDYELDMTSLHPYVGWRALNGRLDLWTTVGYGSGDLKITEANATPATADATLQTLGVGGSGTLLASRDTELRVKGEVQATRLEVGQAKDDAFNEMEVSATQTRLALEATRTLTAPNGAQLLPSLELGMRHDGGDGATGNGVEIGAGLRYHNATRGLTLETRLRALLSHSGDTKDQGLSATLNLTPGADRQGLSLSLTPAYGNAASGVQNVWDKGVPAADSDSDLNARMSVEVGYGFAGVGDGLLTPYSEMTLGEDNKTYHLGVRWELSEMFTLNLVGERLQKTDAVSRDVYLLKGEVKF